MMSIFQFTAILEYDMAHLSFFGKISDDIGG